MENKGNLMVGQQWHMNLKVRDFILKGWLKKVMDFRMILYATNAINGQDGKFLFFGGY